MKKRTFCCKEYTDEAVFCSTDAMPLESITSPPPTDTLRPRAKRIWERLKHKGIAGGYTIINGIVRNLTDHRQEPSPKQDESLLTEALDSQTEPPPLEAVVREPVVKAPFITAIGATPALRNKFILLILGCILTFGVLHVARKPGQAGVSRQIAQKEAEIRNEVAEAFMGMGIDKSGVHILRDHSRLRPHLNNAMKAVDELCRLVEQSRLPTKIDTIDWLGTPGTSGLKSEMKFMIDTSDEIEFHPARHAVLDMKDPEDNHYIFALTRLENYANDISKAVGMTAPYPDDK